LKNTPNFEPKDRRVAILLSSDTEFDPPSGNETWQRRSTTRLVDGLPRFLEVCDVFRASATLFSEGKLVEQLPDLFRDLARNHEIGCHSYAHEWLGTKSPPRATLRRDDLAPLRPIDKENVLRRAIAAIQDATGKKPRSFKAPFNSIDDPSTLQLLDQLGFVSDSSLPCFNHESSSLLPTTVRHTNRSNLWTEGDANLIEIPHFVRARLMLFHPFDLGESVTQLLSRGTKPAVEDVDLLCRMDSLLGKSSSVVHLSSHPWEFSELDGRRNKASTQRLVGYLSELMHRFDVEFLTMTEFAAKWEKESCRKHAEGLNG
jgi:peptidoglycan/xylan/chitin deacetylase (PgdA/CDA1 family)